ncbi:tRNA pseudouridine(38-40) synthase TruA [Desulfuromonas sp. AOP6]|uniref:tRNA pseudouridine(38-40) synthase TruA n=1 Tax=Desulfuromonas sp. AOP6 TaxID=1566351 RepID=UPI0012DE311D|nr:tRNA pseudouridine(38-40) synthase TruA [Desulfuromonas sp. AOP6]
MPARLDGSEKQVRLVIEYDGTRYAGWQVQPNGIAVQQVVEEALLSLLGHSVRLVSSGRTDAGVHAFGMVACFRTSRGLPEQAFRDGLNRYLPEDVVIRQANIVPLDFHPRFDSQGKWYRYTLNLSPVRTAINRHACWTIKKPLDLQAMEKAASFLVGRHDFTAFRASNCSAKTTVREIFSIDIVQDGPLLYLDVRGGGFLKFMVRIIVGTLVEVGLGKRPSENVPLLLKHGSRVNAGKTAPPHGLCLMEVWYGDQTPCTVPLKNNLPKV